MRFPSFVFAFALAVFAVGMSSCSTVPQPPNVSGNWQWVCCGGEYSGNMRLTQLSDGQISGTMHGRGVINEVSGNIKGRYVYLLRKMGPNQQDYYLTLSPNGKKMTGQLRGVRDKLAGMDFEAKRD